MASPDSSPADLIPRADQPLPTGAAKTASVRAMFDTIAPRYDLVNRVMTFRMDVGWRRRALDLLGLAPGARVLDLATGTGDLAAEMASRGLVPIGADLSFGMLAAAPTPFPRVQADGVALPFPDGALDGATCGFALRNFTDLAATVAELGRVVRPGGRLALLEVAEPPNPIMRMGHGIYFGRVVPVIGGILSNGRAYSYLPRSVEYLPEPAELLDVVRDSGFRDVDRTLLSGGIAQLITATRVL
ncbi:MAG TPA: ubiquinone/menaquinone biosynthesis methyltransferase [Microthrixaceae bacterium]|nr:ubiquinone/menaquinone biosynthesis methyltransferase [Microthrixaceae bacterium]MCB9375370.1 ubiquinone/menaquinone biosynthesis methyltransferase [Microthrixaceae bacterium]MCB9400257.1 ubiquinone/menaquinone biosynthesis methyltransferase [Microthrixaceae bacterium]MCO5306412.1 ubiquinone/menaquinone biosynthesis methyltransferase [Microthrixaceae bacterium]HMV74061.1 ubiquinone/menaquinone biosynthesis methyltransferase [Microthrixaceae bacterium]